MSIDVPIALGSRARDWDDQNLDVLSAADTVAGASTGGFTAGVSGGARTFATTWERLLRDLAARAEFRADGLRDTLEDFIAQDASLASDLRVASVRLEQR